MSLVQRTCLSDAALESFVKMPPPSNRFIYHLVILSGKCQNGTGWEGGHTEAPLYPLAAPVGLGEGVWFASGDRSLQDSRYVRISSGTLPVYCQSHPDSGQ